MINRIPKKHLQEKDVLDIYDMLFQGYTYTEIAHKHNISLSQVYIISKGKSHGELYALHYRGSYNKRPVAVRLEDAKEALVKFKKENAEVLETLARLKLSVERLYNNLWTVKNAKRKRPSSNNRQLPKTKKPNKMTFEQKLKTMTVDELNQYYSVFQTKTGTLEELTKRKMINDELIDRTIQKLKIISNEMTRV